MTGRRQKKKKIIFRLTYLNPSYSDNEERSKHERNIAATDYNFQILITNWCAIRVWWRLLNYELRQLYVDFC